jgi:DNA-binding MarR family transcriptional regulator
MKTAQTQSTTGMVREYAAAVGMLRKKDVQQALGLTVDQVKGAVESLLEQGYLIRVRHGLYQAAGTVEKPLGETVDKIWRAMKVSATFSASDIAKLAASTTSYVYKRLREYRADGLIRPAGMRNTYGSGAEKLWRLTPKGKEKAQAPAAEVFEPDPLVMAAVNLNRLICSGLAVRNESAARSAMDSVTVIAQALNEVLEMK